MDEVTGNDSEMQDGSARPAKAALEWPGFAAGSAPRGAYAEPKPLRDGIPGGSAETLARPSSLLWYGAESYGAWFGRGAAARMRRLRWAAGLPAAQKRTMGDGNNKRTLAYADARLPDGQTLAEFVGSWTYYALMVGLLIVVIIIYKVVKSKQT